MLNCYTVSPVLQSWDLVMGIDMICAHVHEGTCKCVLVFHMRKHEWVNTYCACVPPDTDPQAPPQGRPSMQERSEGREHRVSFFISMKFKWDLIRRCSVL